MADRLTRDRRFRRVLLLLGIFFVLVQVNRSAGGVLATYLTRAQSMGPTDIGAVMGTMFFSSAIAQLPTGVLLDWLGPRRTLVYAGYVAVAGIVLFASLDSVWGMMAGRFAIGIGHGGVITAIYLVAMSWAPPGRIGQATATVVGIGGGIGGILATAPLAYALEGFGFEASFLGLAAATLAATVALQFWLSDDPHGEEASAPPQRDSLGETIRGLLVVLRMRELWRIFAMGFCFSAPFMAIGGLWAGPYFIEVQSVETGTASLVLLSLFLALHFGTFCYGPLERRAKSRKRLILAGAGVEVAAMAVLAVWPTAPAALAWVTLFLFGCAAPFYVVLVSHARSFVPARRAGRAMTCINLVGLTGTFVMQSGTGVLIELARNVGAAPEAGYRLVFLSIIAILVVCAAIYSRQPESGGMA